MSLKRRLSNEPEPIAQGKGGSRSKSKRLKNGDEERKDSQSTILVKLAHDAGIELFHTPGADSEGFASVPVDGHRETWRIGAKAFRYWLQRLYWKSQENAANSQAIQDAIGVLRGSALFDGPEIAVAVRLAEAGGSIWLDLGNDDWQAVCIDRDRWRVIDCPAVRFHRPRGLLSLPTPERGGSIDELRPFLNIGSEGDWMLILAWLVAAFRPTGPYPLLAVHGEQGSAKSTACRVLRSLIDPNTAALRPEPRDPRDLIIAASNGTVVALENLSSIPVWLSDALCRLATGGGFGTRELFSDGEEKLFNAMRPILINGITELATRSDLLDRTIAVHLPTIPDEKRQTESEFTAKLNRARPRILGAMLDGVSTALRNLESVELDHKPRMADFAVWGTAAEAAWGCDRGAFLAAYSGNRELLNEAAIESCIIAPPLLQFFEGKNEWEGTATELLQQLVELVGEQGAKRKGWPKRSNNLSADLIRIAPNLRQMNIEIEFGKRRGRRFVRIFRKSLQNGVHSVPESTISDTVAPNSRPAASDQSATASNESTEKNAKFSPLDALGAQDADSRDSSECDYDRLMDAFPPP